MPTTHPAPTDWRGRRWALALLLAGLGSIGPFAVDTYLPAFEGIGAAIGATPVQMQQTLATYLAAFAVMNLFHGALADSFGRRPVVLVNLGLFALASAGCALAQDIGTLLVMRALQGLSAGAGMVVSRAILRDLFAPQDAQRVMSQVTIFFGVAPAVAPLVGGLLFAAAGWSAIFWFLAALSAALALLMWARLPESLPVDQRQPFAVAPLLEGYGALVRSPRFLLLVLAGAVPFNGMFLYVLAAPAFLGTHLGLAPTEFFWFFAASVAGIMAGAWLSGRLAGRMPPRAQLRLGFALMTVVALANVALNLALEPHPAWSIWPVTLYALGWSLTAPVITLLVLDQAPTRRGMAASVQASLGSAVNALVAAVVVPLAMTSAAGLALASAAALAIGLAAWAVVERRVT
ncbi:MAG: multidrug effflux MFS transporter [Pseudomonadota bacterium]